MARWLTGDTTVLARGSGAHVRGEGSSELRSLRRAARVLAESIGRLEERDRHGLVSDGPARIARLREKLRTCHEELSRLCGPAAPDALDSARQSALDDAETARVQLLERLRRLPASSPTWEALCVVFERMTLDEPAVLGDSTLEDVPPELAQAAGTIAGSLFSMAFHRRASHAAIEALEAMAVAGATATTGSGWYDSLCALFRAHSGRDFPGKNDRHRVWFVLNHLRLHAGLRGALLPRVLREPEETQIRRAEEVLRQTSPTLARRGRRYSDETRAKKFAHAFKLYPPNLRDVDRQR
jgi:hypothetical protein